MKQSFPFHGKGCKQHLLDASLSQELYRIVTSQGAVIRYLRDGSTEVYILYTDAATSSTCVFTTESRSFPLMGGSQLLDVLLLLIQ